MALSSRLPILPLWVCFAILGGINSSYLFDTIFFIKTYIFLDFFKKITEFFIFL